MELAQGPARVVRWLPWLRGIAKSVLMYARDSDSSFGERADGVCARC